MLKEGMGGGIPQLPPYPSMYDTVNNEICWLGQHTIQRIFNINILLYHVICITAFIYVDVDMYWVTQKLLRIYILQIPQPSQYRCAKLLYRFAVTFGTPSINQQISTSETYEAVVHCGQGQAVHRSKGIDK